MPNQFDLVVIGDGAAGDSVARPAASVGKRVALVEKDKLGGECLNYGCVPSKTVIRFSARTSSLRTAPTSSMSWRSP
jgi:pyruvate/2-oxoglutarate dehydrogenase complex dihydrolipoamide dehydrogenase (E3) component